MPGRNKLVHRIGDPDRPQQGSPAARRDVRQAYRDSFPLYASRELRVRTKPPEPRLVRLYPFLPPQAVFYESAERQRREIGFIRQVWLKARQVGGSTLSLGLLFALASLNKYTNTFTSAHDAETAQELFKTVHLFYDCLSPAIKPKTRHSTKKRLSFEDVDDPDAGLRSSMVVDTAKNIHLAVGRTLSAMHFSEVARYDPTMRGTLAISATLGAVPLAAGTIIIMESTAFVTGAWFKDQCARAQRGEGAWRFVFVPWFKSPEYRRILAPGEVLRLNTEERGLVRQHGLTPRQIKFMRMKIAEFRGDENQFHENYPSTPDEAWITLGSSIFPAADRRKLALHLRNPVQTYEIIPPKHILPVTDGPLWVWEPPQPGVEYDLAIDVAMERREKEKGEEDEEGPSDERAAKPEEPQNFSAIEVVKRGTLEQVAEWKGQVDPFALSEIAACLGYWYNMAQIAPEAMGIGIATASHLSTVLQYPNLYRWRYRDRIVPKLTPYIGWETRHKSKQYMVAFGLSVVRTRDEKVPLIHSTRLYEEIEAFVKTGPDQYGAAAGHFDDLIMSWLIALVTSNDEDYSRFTEGEENHQEEVQEKFYEPGKAPRVSGADPAYTDMDASEFSLLGGTVETDGW